VESYEIQIDKRNNLFDFFALFIYRIKKTLLCKIQIKFLPSLLLLQSTSFDLLCSGHTWKAHIFDIGGPNAEPASPSASLLGSLPFGRA
jgi:hypothetical protein